MTWSRSLLWLVALIAFVLPPLGTASIAHASASVERTDLVGCPEHAPPPDCPAEGTAKHAAGQCCPLMAGVVALAPPVMLAQPLPPLHPRPATVALDLTGLDFTQDPPPPRV